MTFEEAIRVSIKSYLEGRDPEAYLEAAGTQPKYTREYFDQLEEDVLSEEVEIAELPEEEEE